LLEIQNPDKHYGLVLSTVKPTLLAAEVLQAAPGHLVSPETAEIVDDKVKFAKWMKRNGLHDRVPRTVSWFQVLTHPDDDWIESHLGGFPIIVKYPRGEGSSHVYLCRDRKELDFLIESLGSESNNRTLAGGIAPEEFSVHEYAGEPATYVDVYVRQGQIQAFKCYHYTQELIPKEELSRGGTSLQLSDLHIGENKRPMRTPANFRNVTCDNRPDFLWLAERLAKGLELKGAWGFHTATSRRSGLNVVMDLNVRIDAVQAGRFKEELGRWLREMLDRYPD
jgi:biotin carboxylase